MPGLVPLLAPYAGSQAHVILEESQAMPGQGTRSMFTVGVGLGVLLGVLAALQLPYSRVRPATWKRALGLGKEKEQARLRAMQLFPVPQARPWQSRGVAAGVVWLAIPQSSILNTTKMSASRHSRSLTALCPACARFAAIDSVR